MNNTETTHPAGTANPAADNTTEPQRPLTITWLWSCELTIGSEIIPIRGNRWVDFYDDPEDFGNAVALCDNWIALDLESQILAYLKGRLLLKPVPPGDSNFGAEYEVRVKFIFKFTATAAGVAPYEFNGMFEKPLKMDRQFSGHLKALERMIERMFYKEAKTSFRSLAIAWLEKAPATPSRAKALRMLNTQLNDLWRPNTLADDKLPETIRSIEITPPQTRN